MDDELKSALSQQALQLEALDRAMAMLRDRLDALTSAMGTLDRTVHQAYAVSLSVRERVDTLDHSVQRLASSASNDDRDLPIN